MDKTNLENTSLKKKKIEKIQDDRHKMRLQVRQENGQNIDKSFQSDVHIKLKYYGEQNGYEIKLQDDFDDTVTLTGYQDQHLEQDTIADIRGELN